MSAVLAEKAATILDKRESERARTVKLFHRNAAIKNGIPWEDQDSAVTMTEKTELAIIGKLVDKLAGSPPKDGANGNDAVVDYDRIVASVKEQLPQLKNGRDGRDGKDADPDAVAELVRKQLSDPKWKDWLKVIAASTLGAGAVATPIGYYLGTGGDKPPEQPPPVVQPQDGSLLQWLEDHGYSVGDL